MYGIKCSRVEWWSLTLYSANQKEFVVSYKTTRGKEEATHLLLHNWWLSNTHLYIEQQTVKGGGLLGV